MVDTLGSWDCPNKRCSTYHALRKYAYTDHMPSPRCPTCRKPLRLLRVSRPMSEATKRRLRALAKELPHA